MNDSVLPPTPTAKRLRMTWVLIGLNVAVAAAMVVMGVFVQLRSQDLLFFGANFGAQVVIENQWWRPLTAMFVHIGAVHLLVNMYSLRNVGLFVERFLGGPKLLVIYLLTGLGGSFASMLWNPLAVSAGASGAILGLFGVIIGFTIRGKDHLPPAAFESLKSAIITTLGLMGILMALAALKVFPLLDNAAHFGGLGVGVLSGVMATSSALENPDRRVTWSSQAIVLATVVGLAILAKTRTEHRPQLMWEYWLQRAQIALESEQYPKAVELASKALEMRPDPAAYELRGTALMLESDYEGAVEDFEKADRSPGLSNNLAWMLVRLDRNLTGALELADEAVSADRNPAFLGTRCWVHAARMEFEEAKRDCEEAVTMNADDKMDQGMLHFLKGENSQALQVWQEAAQQNPSHAYDLEPWFERARDSKVETL